MFVFKFVFMVMYGKKDGGNGGERRGVRRRARPNSGFRRGLGEAGGELREAWRAPAGRLWRHEATTINQSITISWPGQRRNILARALRRSTHLAENQPSWHERTDRPELRAAAISCAPRKRSQRPLRSSVCLSPGLWPLPGPERGRGARRVQLIANRGLAGLGNCDWRRFIRKLSEVCEQFEPWTPRSCPRLPMRCVCTHEGLASKASTQALAIGCPAQKQRQV